MQLYFSSCIHQYTCGEKITIISLNLTKNNMHKVNLKEKTISMSPNGHKCTSVMDIASGNKVET